MDVNLKDTLNYNLHKFLVREENNENLILKEYFGSIVSIFNSELEKKIFDKYLNRNKERFYKLLNDIRAEDIYIEEQLILQKKEIAVLKTVKQMLNEFRCN